MEVLFAVTIIVVVLLGITLLSNAAVKNTVQAKHRLQIALFAQEKIELVRNIRDSAINLNTDWNSFFTTPIEMKVRDVLSGRRRH